MVSYFELAVAAITVSDLIKLKNIYFIAISLIFNCYLIDIISNLILLINL